MRTPSITAGGAGWHRIALAARVAADVAEGRQAPERLLQLAVEAGGVERAFVVADQPVDGRFRLVARWPAADDRGRGPSRSAAARALAGSRALAYLDVARELAPGAPSVRALALRTVAAAPLPPDRAGARAALLVDSRRPCALPPAELREVVATFAALVALALGRAVPRGARSQATAPRAPRYPSLAERRLARWIPAVARTSLAVLVQGESGSGKERVAREIHAHSPRVGGPFVALNCGALPEGLLDSELFGAVRGAYTGAVRDRPGLFRLAHGGTLLLDEVGDMPASMQARLLRVLEQGCVRPVGGGEEHAVDARIVSASHRDLARLVERGVFREDLYYRLAVLRVEVPALRERREDLPALIRDLGPRLARETGLAAPRLADDAWHALAAHDWPGNVRELHAVLARALLRAGGGEIRAEHLGRLGRLRPGDRAPRGETSLEREMIEAALAGAGGSITAAAARIGWTRQKLYRRLKALGLRTTSSHSSTFQ